MIELEFVKSSDPRYERRVVEHYPAQLDDKKKRGERKVSNYGQALHFLVLVDEADIGLSSAGCAVYTVKSRDDFFGLPKGGTARSPENMLRSNYVQSIVNHTQFILDDGHGVPNLGTQVLRLWRETVLELWPQVYGVRPIGYETFVDPASGYTGPGQRTGSMYLADNWTNVGLTVGLTKQHLGSEGMNKGWHEQEIDLDSGTVRRPTTRKFVFCRWATSKSARAVACGDLPDVYRSTWRSDDPESRALKKARQNTRSDLYGQRFTVHDRR